MDRPGFEALEVVRVLEREMMVTLFVVRLLEAPLPVEVCGVGDDLWQSHTVL